MAYDAATDNFDAAIARFDAAGAVPKNKEDT
jgi:hypothetical protein